MVSPGDQWVILHVWLLGYERLIYRLKVFWTCTWKSRETQNHWVEYTCQWLAEQCVMFFSILIFSLTSHNGKWQAAWWFSPFDSLLNIRTTFITLLFLCLQTLFSLSCMHSQSNGFCSVFGKTSWAKSTEAFPFFPLCRGDLVSQGGKVTEEILLAHR